MLSNVLLIAEGTEGIQEERVSGKEPVLFAVVLPWSRSVPPKPHTEGTVPDQPLRRPTGLCNKGLYTIYMTEREQHEHGPLDHLGKIPVLPSSGFPNCGWSPHTEVLDCQL